MSELKIECPTTKSTMGELRPLLDQALKTEFPGGMMKSRWEGDVLHLHGPGAQGTVELVDGHLVGQATLRPPASMMRPVIEKKMSQVLSSAASA
jgi:hypothetical protein